MDTPNHETLYARLASQPSILFLGQSYLAEGESEDGFITSVRQRFSLGEEDGVPPLTALVGKLEHEDQSASLSWLHRRSGTVPISESLNLISDFPWSNVYTSAVDEVWVRAFKKTWRSLNTVFAEYAWPLETRDRNRLCTTFLFGCVDKADEDSRVPTDPFQLDERLQTAVTLLRRLPEIVTPFGSVLIEGYDPTRDWLTPKNLYPVLNSLGQGQIFYFSRRATDENDRYLKKLRDDGKLVFIKEDLGTFLRRGVEQESITLGDLAIKLPAGRQITIDSKPNVIPKDLWLNLAGTAIILDDNAFIPAKPLSADREYLEYRHFLADPIRPNDWSAYERGFVFERDFYRQLKGECERRLKQTRLQLTPILLHGESGTGKSVALANLGYRLGSQGEAPVLFIERTISSVDWRPIDRFLNWAEDCGATCSLILWDGMRSENDYFDLLGKLSDRGRKVILVGTSYSVSRQKHKFTAIEATRELNSVEKEAFKRYLSRFDSGFVERIQSNEIRIDPTFLVALYRLLPPARPRLTKGFVDEVAHEEKAILERTQALPTQSEDLNSLQFAFSQIGWPEEAGPAFSDSGAEIQGETRTELQELFALVMVPGKYGFKVPIELLLGALGKSVNSTMLKALQTAVLDWAEKPGGEILVGPRHPLEAKLYIDHFYGGAAEAEALFITKLIHGLKRAPVGDPHVDFIIDLLRTVGPNSPSAHNKKHFARCFLKIAESLTALRQERNILSPRLMLQEGSFYREAVRDDGAGLSAQETLRLLETAEGVLLEARDREDCPPPLRSVINADLAACYGTMIRTVQETSPGSQEIVRLYERARESLTEAMRLESANAHAVVVLGWISRDMLRSAVLTDQERGEIEAELLFRFDEAAPATMDATQQEYYYRERHHIMDQLGNLELAQQTFDLLKRTGSKAGYFLRARRLFEAFPEDEATLEQKRDFSATEAYLRENWAEISTDERCLGLYLKAWWFSRTGMPVFHRERQILPFSDTDWHTLNDVVRRLKEIKEPDCPAWVRLLFAVSSFQLGNVGPAMLDFREMSSDTNLNMGGNRLKKFFVASWDGVPRPYSGVVQSRVKDRMIGQIYVNDLRHSIQIIPRDFDQRELTQGQNITDFFIAFAYTGPIAQPAHFIRTRHEKS
jgi:hypothetical protein